MDRIWYFEWHSWQLRKFRSISMLLHSADELRNHDRADPGGATRPPRTYRNNSIRSYNGSHTCTADSRRTLDMLMRILMPRSNARCTPGHPRQISGGRTAGNEDFQGKGVSWALQKLDIAIPNLRFGWVPMSISLRRFPATAPTVRQQCEPPAWITVTGRGNALIMTDSVTRSSAG